MPYISALCVIAESHSSRWRTTDLHSAADSISKPTPHHSTQLEPAATVFRIVVVTESRSTRKHRIIESYRWDSEYISFCNYFLWYILMPYISALCVDTEYIFYVVDRIVYYMNKRSLPRTNGIHIRHISIVIVHTTCMLAVWRAGGWKQMRRCAVTIIIVDGI